MKKNYKRIRLEFNEGRTREQRTRHQWKTKVSELPSQEQPKKGYNKHYYEIDINGDGKRILKFRMDVCDQEHTDFTEDDIREFVANHLIS